MKNEQKILKQNNTYNFISEYTILKELPNSIYELDWDLFSNCSLKELQKEFTLPSKIYETDKEKNFKKRVIHSYKSINKNLGVLLIGKKGTGKSVCAKSLCNELGIPVILIKKSIPKKVDFMSFLEKYEGEYVLFIDEFEKIFLDYTEEENYTQEDLLSFFDGVSTNKKRMILLTSNSQINDHFINRPSRVKFLRNYSGIDLELGSLIIKETLEIKEFSEDLISNINSEICTIDILTSIIEEINIHKIPYSEFKEDFNFKDDVNLAYDYFTFNEEEQKWESEIDNKIKDYIEENSSRGKELKKTYYLYDMTLTLKDKTLNIYEVFKDKKIYCKIMLKEKVNRFAF